MNKYRLYIFFIFLFFSKFLYSQKNKNINLNGYNKFYYKNGNLSSEGNFKNGKPEGIWKNYYENGILKSIGNRKKHELYGKWEFYTEKGLIKEKITYKDNKKNGITKIYNSDGFLDVETNYINNIKNGVEKIYYADIHKLHIEKRYKEGILEGISYEYDKKGNIITWMKYEKDFIQFKEEINRYNKDNLKDGLWIEFYENLRYNDGEKIMKLEGKYNLGKKNGYWKEYNKKGNIINIINYSNDKIQKENLEKENLEVKYEYFDNGKIKKKKSYLNGKPEGIWKSYKKNGKIENIRKYNDGILYAEGLFDSLGMKTDIWKFFYEDGNLLAQGKYQNGLRIKKWKFYFNSGEVEQIGTYKRGRKHGDWNWYFKNGQLHRTESFFNNKEEGEIIEYNNLNKIILKGNYTDGFEDGKWKIEMGDEIEEGTYSLGKKNGLWTRTYINNNKTAFKGNYLDGMENGKFTWYYENGNKMLEGKFDYGTRIGEWKRFDENGVIVFITKYKYGLPVKLNGNKIKFK